MGRNYTLSGIEPADVWNYFYQISQIPRKSGNREPITSYLMDFCKEHAIKAYRDDAYNVIAQVPATPGYEHAPSVILHSHVDMVCIKDEGVEHDFSKDPIHAYAENGIITAEGTTLGGDDGIGMAFMLACMADPEAEHPALECVFTADEETDMDGGRRLDYTQLKSRYYINIDGMGVAVGSAGEIDARLLLPRGHTPVKEHSVVHKVSVGGLKGGHSGAEALLERANAITLLNRVLLELTKHGDIQILSLQGGRAGGCMATAIPTSASAVIAVPESCLDGARDAVAACTAMLKKEYARRDPDISIAMVPCDSRLDALCDRDTVKVLDLLTLLPDGPRSTHQDFAQTLGSTSNVGVLESRDDVVELAVTIRSTDTKRFYLYEQVCRLAGILGVDVELLCDFPAWEYSVNDRWMDMIRRLYPGYPPFLLGGTGEIGYFTEHIPGLNAVSLTPSAYNCHSTGEYLDIQECAYFYNNLKTLLKQMKELEE